jgi:diguanylate cyclase (GGDEF)-like protein
MPLSNVVLHPFVAPASAAIAPLCLADHRGGSDGPARHLEDLHARGVRVRRTTNPAETAEALAGGRHCAVLLDPVGAGPVELEAILRAAPSLPVLLALGAQNAEAALAVVEAETAGGSALVDVMPRGASAAEIALRLAQLERAATWRHRASHDERTECLRPEAFEARLVETHSAARRHRFPLALVLLDLDDFGRVNKRHDHTVGDRVISRAGRVLRDSLRAEDLAGRVGGDEFALALPFTDLAEAERCTERVLAELARTPIVGRENAGVYVTASAGIAVHDTGDSLPLEVIRRHAESALREAKESGGNVAIAWQDDEVRENLAVAE